MHDDQLRSMLDDLASSFTPHPSHPRLTAAITAPRSTGRRIATALSIAAALAAVAGSAAALSGNESSSIETPADQPFEQPAPGPVPTMNDDGVPEDGDEPVHTPRTVPDHQEVIVVASAPAPIESAPPIVPEQPAFEALPVVAVQPATPSPEAPPTPKPAVAAPKPESQPATTVHTPEPPAEPAPTTTHQDNSGEQSPPPAPTTTVHSPEPPATTTTHAPNVGFSASQAFGSCGANPPYDEFSGTASPGATISVTSPHGSGSTTADGGGHWTITVFFPSAPVGETFTVSVSASSGGSTSFSFVRTA